jgi:hypothetical protein
MTGRDPMTVHELRTRAESIAMAVEEGLAALARAASQAEALRRDAAERTIDLERFWYQVEQIVETLCDDLVEHRDPEEGGTPSIYTLDQIGRDARDLLDLIDLAGGRKEAADAGR